MDSADNYLFYSGLLLCVCQIVMVIRLPGTNHCCELYFNPFDINMVYDSVAINICYGIYSEWTLVKETQLLHAAFQAVELGNRERLLAFCEAVQRSSPVGSFTKPIAGSTPGYASEVWIHLTLLSFKFIIGINLWQSFSFVSLF